MLFYQNYIAKLKKLVDRDSKQADYATKYTAPDPEIIYEQAAEEE